MTVSGKRSKGGSMIRVWIYPFSHAFLSNKLFGYELPLNRDDCLSPFRYLRKYCLEKGIELDTIDLWKRDSSCENVYVAFNYRGPILTKHAVKKKIKSILTKNELKKTIMRARHNKVCNQKN